MKLNVILIRAIVINFIGLFFMNEALSIYASFMHYAPLTWDILGRWVTMLAHGQFYTRSIANYPIVPYEGIIGLTANYLIGFIFSLFYVITTPNMHPRVHLFWGVLFGLILVFFSLVIEYPSMGMGFFGKNTSQPLATLMRTLFVHSSFGFGLGVGSYLLIFMNKINRT